MLDEAAMEQDSISIGNMFDTVGRRSFGPLILCIGLIALSPLSGIPTVPSIMGVLVTLIAVQLLIGRDYFWLPKKLLDRRIPSDKARKGIKFLRRPSRLVDRIIRPRLTVFTHDVGAFVIAIICVVIGVTMPPLELLPFVASAAGAALTLFGLALISHDGVVALVAMAATVGLAVMAVQHLL